MSAFLVGKDTIDRIITAMDYELRQDSYLQIKMEEMTGVSYDDTKWKDLLGTLMINMNQMALGERYGDKMEKHTYTFYPKLATRIQYLKSLQCFTYQCAEGVIPQTKLYDFFDRVLERKFMTAIIYSMSEYDKAQWA